MLIYLIKLILILVFNTCVNICYINSECKCCCDNTKSGEIGSGSKGNLDTNSVKGHKPIVGPNPQKVKIPVKAKHKLNNDHNPLLDTNPLLDINQLYAPLGSKGGKTGDKKEEENKNVKKENINNKDVKKKEKNKDDEKKEEELKEVKKDTNNPILIELNKYKKKITIDLKNLKLSSKDIKECIVHKSFTNSTTFCLLDEVNYNSFTTNREITFKNMPDENTFVLFAVKTASGKYYLGYCKNGNSVNNNGLFEKIYTNVEIIILGFGNNLINTEYMFYDCGNLKKITFNPTCFNTSNVTSMKGMFKKCNKLDELDLSTFDTSKVTSMSGMFEDCKLLTKLNVSRFNTSNVANMSNMFYGCNSLTSLNVSNFNTNKVINMSYMFSGCSALTELNLSKFNTNNVTNMTFMFSRCSSLEELNLSNFNTSNGTNINNMFYGCDNLKGNVTTKDKNINNMYGQFIKKDQ